MVTDTFLYILSIYEKMSESEDEQTEVSRGLFLMTCAD